MFLRLARDILDDYIEKIYIYFIVRGEINKFNDQRRKNIYNKVKLSKSDKQNIDFLYNENLGRKISYIWHKHYTAFTGTFDKYYFPEVLYIPKFERFLNLEKQYTFALSDKNLFYTFAKGVGIKTPVTLLSCAEGMFRNKYNLGISKAEAIELLSNVGMCFCKPTVDSCSGQGCFVANLENGIDIDSGKAVIKLMDALGDNFVVQERLECHEQIAKLHPNSCNTFRIITYRWLDQFYVIPSIMRIGVSGKCVDNAHAGGIFIAVDEDGTLHEKAFTEFNNQYTQHPTTGIKFAGYKIDGFPLCVEAALKMHNAVPQIGVVNWDFTLDKNNEPVVIEANLNGGSVWMSEMAHGCGPFGEKTAEILQWIALMEKLSLRNRKNHKFGKM